MTDEDKGARRTPAGRERTLDEHGQRIDDLEDRMLVAETKGTGREKKADRAIAGVIALGIAIASGVVVAFLAGGHP